MERKFYTDDFEELLKQKTDEFRIYPSKRVWHSIYNNLHPSRKWPSIAVTIVLIFALLLVGYWNNNSSIANKTKTIALLQKNDNGISTESTNLVSNNNSINMLNKVSSVNAGNAWLPNYNFNNSVPVTVNNNSAVKNYLSNNFTANNINNKASIYSIYTFNNNTATQLQPAINEASNNTTANDFVTSDIKANESNPLNIATLFNSNINTQKNIPVVNNQQINSLATLTSTDNNTPTLSEQDKAWIEAYAFHNKSKRKKWRDRTSVDFYATPGISYRRLYSTHNSSTPTATPPFAATFGVNANAAVSQKPDIGLEVGIGLTYTAAKKLRLKAALQFNYTNYGLSADDINHPIVTTVSLVNPSTNIPYLSAVSSTLANSSGLQPTTLHNKTYQVSIPIGFAYKLFGNSKLEWFAGANIQPTYVMGGQAYLISADAKNYISNPSAINKFNVNTGVETYVTYKFNNFTLQAGPQFRYQLYSTYNKQYTVKENLFSGGIKFGIIKNF